MQITYSGHTYSSPHSPGCSDISDLTLGSGGTSALLLTSCSSRDNTRDRISAQSKIGCNQMPDKPYAL